MSQEKEWSKGVKITNKQKKNNKLYSTFGFSRELANNNHRTIEGHCMMRFIHPWRIH